MLGEGVLVLRSASCSFLCTAAAEKEPGSVDEDVHFTLEVRGAALFHSPRVGCAGAPLLEFLIMNEEERQLRQPLK